MLELEQAQENILAAINPLAAESISLAAAADRFAAETIRSPIDLPPFDNSAMDGYAVRSDDVMAASPQSPITLQLIGRIPAGEPLLDQIGRGTCARIFTGSPLPPGADAVVMQEDTRIDPMNPEQVTFLDKARPWEHVRLRGEDVRQNSVLLEAGERLTIGRIGLLAATGMNQVRVARRPLVALLATGNELREPGQVLQPGEIFESNRVCLSVLAARAGARIKTYPIVPDDLQTTKRALQTALEECDGLITSGGVSVGELDFVKAAFEELGGQMDFWRVNVKPGKPFVFARWRDKFLFGLPGNPVSALVTCFLLVVPALRRWQGAKNVFPRAYPGILSEPLVNHGDRRHFMRVSVDACGKVQRAGTQASHILSGLALASGLVDVAASAVLPAGATVPVLRWD